MAWRRSVAQMRRDPSPSRGCASCRTTIASFPRADDDGTPQVRDAENVIGPLFAKAGLRGVVLRPDRYVAACIAAGEGADAADARLDALVALADTSSTQPREDRRASLAAA